MSDQERSLALRCAQDSAAWRSVSTSQNPAIELVALLSEKPTPQPLSWRGWRTKLWTKRLCGTIFAPSTADRLLERWTSSLPAIHVSRSQRQVDASAPTIRAISGPRSTASSVRSRPGGFSARTSKGISTWDSPMSFETFTIWASMLRLDCSRRMRSARATRGGVYSCWPTPTVRMSGNRGEMKLAGNAFVIRPATDQAGNQVGLKEAAKCWSSLWMLARAMGFGVTAKSYRPFSLPLHVNCRPGTRSLPGEWTFNPRFSDWIMGWPIGWSDAERPVTEWCHWLQRSRGLLFELLSTGVYEALDGTSEVETSLGAGRVPGYRTAP